MSILARAKALMDQHNVRLVVIDSIANAFKDVLSSEGRPSDALYRIMNLLKRYASEYDACVVLTNHVSDHIEDSAVHRATKRAEVPLHTSGRRVKASLGMGFAQSVTCRYFVSRLHGIRLNEREYVISTHPISLLLFFHQVLFANHALNISSSYSVTCLRTWML